MFNIFYVYWNYDVLLYILHWSELVSKAWTHNVCSLKDEFQCARICCESWVHVWIHVDQFQGWNCFLLNENEVMVVIDYHMLTFSFFSSFHFECHYFWFLIPKNCNLLLTKFRLIQNRLSHIFSFRFTDCLLMSRLLCFFQHIY